MKFNLVQNTAVLLLGAVALAYPTSADAGWGVLRGGSSGGGDSSGYASSGASSGGYSAAYGSSGYAAAYGSSGGASSGSYTAAYSSVGGSSGAYGGSSGGRPGLLQRVAERIHDHWDAKKERHAARRAAYGSSGGYASSGGSVGYATYSSHGGGSSGGSSGGYGVSYGSSGGSVNYGSTGYSSGVSYGSTGVYYGASNSQASAASLVSNASTEGDAVYLTVAVPSDAKVFVNNDQTSSTGAVRKFVSHGLQAGNQYRFVIRAELTAADGRLLTEEKTLVVKSGEQEDVQFAFADSYSPIDTAITLNLPEGAKVLLAGNETKATGETRTFRTSRLKVGELWDDYEIEVHYDGQIKRQAVRLVGGDQLQLTFDFNQDAANLAAR